MEFFQKAKVVRLRSYHDKFLIANANGETVYQDLQGRYENAKWTVEISDSDDDHNKIRLRSCFGKYLTATNMPFILGSTGKKVMQKLPSNSLNSSSFEWEPIRDGMLVKLKTREGRFLRANDFRIRPWKNSVTHDNPHRTATTNWTLWDVEIVELREHDSCDDKLHQVDHKRGR
ncbi:hypothetical protein PIB30_018412 [Stylosanthes scabra]|uniref:DUF569 domain-containing protein n=1 Tax=Stylosanthes scabra TaxID=79078 RepID=A0ABU6T9X0_9FABA|nr:hypothetical protein [Stylosanthes scabra]